MKKYLPICLILIFSIICLSISKNENKTLKDNTKKDAKDIIIASYVNGVYTDELPTESKYFGYVKCFDNSGNEIDSLGFVTWENNKWNVKVTDISASGTCNVYFIDPPAHWLDAESGTLLKAIKDNNTVENVRSIPGKQINKEDEAVLSGTLDDYGTSYFFRGNVKNNYVQFAGKCWKIVRVDGNGNIKLWLWNNNGTDCSTSNAQGSAFSIYSNSPTYIGFMYGNKESNKFSTIDETGFHDNLYDSTILENLKTWYDSTFNTENSSVYTDLLADVIWCADKSISSGNGIDSVTSYFGYSRRKNSPSLICPDAGAKDDLSRYTARQNTDENNAKGNGKLKTLVEQTNPAEYKYYKIGLINFDETLLAGGKDATENTKYYLYTGYFSWTMTPHHSANGTPAPTAIHNNGKVDSYYTTSDGVKMHPSVSLNYNVQATYNASSEYEPGTVNNPYVISV